MSWNNESLSGYELECKERMDIFLKRLSQPATEEEWMKIISIKIPNYLQAKALEYVLEKQKNIKFNDNRVYTYTETKEGRNR